jgi:hypothetical protein
MLFTYQLFNQETQKQDPSLITKHLDIASALPYLDPGLYSTVKSNAERISTHLAILPLGSLKLKSQISAW